MEQTRCANVSCPRHTDYAGGRFRFVRGEWFCHECADMAGTGVVFNTGKNLWDFTTTHFNGHAVHVKSLAHLRELEREHGCSNHAANHMERNWDTPPPAPRPHNPSLGERFGFNG